MNMGEVQTDATPMEVAAALRTEQVLLLLDNATNPVNLELDLEDVHFPITSVVQPTPEVNDAVETLPLAESRNPAIDRTSNVVVETAVDVDAKPDNVVASLEHDADVVSPSVTETSAVSSGARRRRNAEVVSPTTTGSSGGTVTGATNSNDAVALTAGRPQRQRKRNKRYYDDEVSGEFAYDEEEEAELLKSSTNINSRGEMPAAGVITPKAGGRSRRGVLAETGASTFRADQQAATSSQTGRRRPAKQPKLDNAAVPETPVKAGNKPTNRRQTNSRVHASTRRSRPNATATETVGTSGNRVGTGRQRRTKKDRDFAYEDDEKDAVDVLPGNSNTVSDAETGDDPFGRLALLNDLDTKTSAGGQRAGGGVAVGLENVQQNCKTIVTRLLEFFDRNTDRQHIIVPFITKPNRRLYPDYYKEIKRPIDVRTIVRNITQRKYASEQDLMLDVKLLFDNARQYNREDSALYRDAVVLHSLAERTFAALQKQTAPAGLFSRPSSVNESPAVTAAENIAVAGAIKTAVPALEDDEDTLTDPLVEALGGADDENTLDGETSKQTADESELSRTESRTVAEEQPPTNEIVVVAAPGTAEPPREMPLPPAPELSNVPINMVVEVTETVSSTVIPVATPEPDVQLPLIPQTHAPEIEPPLQQQQPQPPATAAAENMSGEHSEFDDVSMDSLSNMSVTSRQLRQHRSSTGSGVVPISVIPEESATSEVVATPAELPNSSERPKRTRRPTVHHINTPIITSASKNLRSRNMPHLQSPSGSETASNDHPPNTRHSRRLSVASSGTATQHQATPPLPREGRPSKTHSESSNSSQYRQKQQSHLNHSQPLAMPTLSAALTDIYDFIVGLRREGRKIAEQFQELPDRQELPDYYKVIRRPVALDRVSERISRQQYATVDALLDDIDQMVENAIVYNETGSKIYQDALYILKMAQSRRAQLYRTGYILQQQQNDANTGVGSENGASDANVDAAGSFLRPIDETYFIIPSVQARVQAIIRRIWKSVLGRRHAVDAQAVLQAASGNGVVAAFTAAHLNDDDSTASSAASSVIMDSTASSSTMAAAAKRASRSIKPVKTDASTSIFSTIKPLTAAEEEILNSANIPFCFESVEQLYRAMGTSSPTSAPKVTWHDIADAVEHGGYKRVDSYQQNVFGILERIRANTPAGTRVHEDAFELQDQFLIARDRECGACGERLISPAVLTLTYRTWLKQTERARRISRELFMQYRETNDPRAAVNYAASTVSAAVGGDGENGKETKRDFDDVALKGLLLVKEEEAAAAKLDDMWRKRERHNDEDVDGGGRTGTESLLPGETAPSASDIPDIDQYRVYDGIRYYLGDFVYLVRGEAASSPWSPNNGGPTLPRTQYDIVYIEQFRDSSATTASTSLRKRGRRSNIASPPASVAGDVQPKCAQFSGTYFIHPHQTRHVATRKFWPKEVFKLQSSCKWTPLSAIRGKCIVVPPGVYFKQRAQLRPAVATAPGASMQPQLLPHWPFDSYHDVYVCNEQISQGQYVFRPWIKKWVCYSTDPNLEVVPRSQAELASLSMVKTADSPFLKEGEGLPHEPVGAGGDSSSGDGVAVLPTTPIVTSNSYKSLGQFPVDDLNDDNWQALLPDFGASDARCRDMPRWFVPSASKLMPDSGDAEKPQFFDQIVTFNVCKMPTPPEKLSSDDPDGVLAHQQPLCLRIGDFVLFRWHVTDAERAYYNERCTEREARSVSSSTLPSIEPTNLIMHIDKMWITDTDGSSLSHQPNAFTTDFALQGTLYKFPHQTSHWPSRLFAYHEVLQSASCTDYVISVRHVINRCVVLSTKDYCTLRPTELSQQRGVASESSSSLVFMCELRYDEIEETIRKVRMRSLAQQSMSIATDVLGSDVQPSSGENSGPMSPAAAAPHISAVGVVDDEIFVLPRKLHVMRLVSPHIEAHIAYDETESDDGKRTPLNTPTVTLPCIGYPHIIRNRVPVVAKNGEAVSNLTNAAVVASSDVKPGTASSGVTSSAVSSAGDVPVRVVEHKLNDDDELENISAADISAVIDESSAMHDDVTDDENTKDIDDVKADPDAALPSAIKNRSRRGANAGSGGKRGRPRLSDAELAARGRNRNGRRSATMVGNVTADTAGASDVLTTTTPMEINTAPPSDGTQSSLGDAEKSNLDSSSPRRSGSRKARARGNKRLVYKLTGFIIFSAHVRKQLMFSTKKRKQVLKDHGLADDALPPAMSLGDSSRLASEKWKALSQEERDEWNRRAHEQANVVNQQRALDRSFVASSGGGTNDEVDADTKDGLISGVAGDVTAGDTSMQSGTLTTPKASNRRRKKKLAAAGEGEQTEKQGRKRKRDAKLSAVKSPADAGAAAQPASLINTQPAANDAVQNQTLTQYPPQQQQYFAPSNMPMYSQQQQQTNFVPVTLPNGTVTMAANGGVLYSQQQPQQVAGYYSNSIQNSAPPSGGAQQPTYVYAAGHETSQNYPASAHQQNGMVYSQQQQPGAYAVDQPRYAQQTPAHQEPMFVAAIRNHHQQQRTDADAHSMLPPYVPQATRLLHSQAYATYWQNIYHPSTDNTHQRNATANSSAQQADTDAARPWERQLYHPSYYGPNASAGFLSSNPGSSRASTSNIIPLTSASQQLPPQQMSSLVEQTWQQRFPSRSNIGVVGLNDDVGGGEDGYVAAGSAAAQPPVAGADSLLNTSIASSGSGSSTEQTEILMQRMWAARNLIMNKLIS